MSTQINKSAIVGYVQMPRLGGSQKGYLKALPSKGPQNAVDELTSDLVLNKLPVYVCSLDSEGCWRPLAQGNDRYFASIDTQDLAQWVCDTVHIQDQVVLLKAVSDCRNTEHDTAAEVRLHNAQDNPHAPQWVEMRCIPIPSKNIILTVVSDISDRKLIEKKMLDERRSADAANVAKTRFLANMSHELRTPLNAIIGFSEILRSGMVPLSEAEKHQEYQCLINDSAHHLLAVLNDILDMSKIESGKYEIFPEEIDLAQIIKSCCSMLNPLADKASTRLHFSEPGDSLRFEADSRVVRQILINLISNAIKFTRPGTDVEISAARIGRKIEFKVIDKGVGIAAESLLRLGEPFLQVDNQKSRNHEGTGLGLSIVKGLVSLHNGEFRIESEVGVGTTVTITLPHSCGISQPVPSPDVDSIIRIKPKRAESGKIEPELSRFVI